jgi:hypothetical protein
MDLTKSVWILQSKLLANISHITVHQRTPGAAADMDSNRAAVTGPLLVQCGPCQSALDNGTFNFRILYRSLLHAITKWLFIMY